MSNIKDINSRKLMELAIEVMKTSIQEDRNDKTSPNVGAVLIKPDGSIDTASRGELREGDHAEFTVIERKNRDVDLSGSVLFATLEPCAPGARNAPKLSCSERIVNARISEVWIGIEDPDPTVNHEGINYLINHGVKVNSFDRDLQKIIEKENKEFLKGAKRRALEVKKPKEKVKSILDQSATHTDLKSLSEKALNIYLETTNSNYNIDSEEFYSELKQLELLEKNNNSYIPTGNAILLFGEKPRLKFQQSSVKAKVDYGNGNIDVQSFDDAIILIPDQIESWLKKVLPESFDRSKFTREKVSSYPIAVIREAIINALVHRDYTIDGAKIQLEITPNKIIIKSPGKPVAPLTIKDLQDFSAPSYTRNKKIAFIFNEMRLIEETGVGMDTFKSLQEKYKLPLPIIEYKKPYIVISLARNTDAIKDIKSNNNAIQQLNDEELIGLDFIKLSKEVSRKEYSEYFGYNDRKSNRHLSKMKELGLIGDNGEGATSPNYRYVYKISD